MDGQTDEQKNCWSDCQTYNGLTDGSNEQRVVKTDRQMDRLMEGRSDGRKDLHTNTLMLTIPKHAN